MALSDIRKALAAVAGTVLTLVVSAWTDGTISPAEWVFIATEGCTAFVVWVTTNGPIGAVWGHAKALVAAVLAGLGIYGGYLAAGATITDAMWLNVAIAVLVPLGVLQLPNTASRSTVRLT